MSQGNIFFSLFSFFWKNGQTYKYVYRIKPKKFIYVYIVYAM